MCFPVVPKLRLPGEAQGVQWEPGATCSLAVADGWLGCGLAQPKLLACSNGPHRPVRSLHTCCMGQLLQPAPAARLLRSPRAAAPVRKYAPSTGTGVGVRGAPHAWPSNARTSGQSALRKPSRRALGRRRSPRQRKQPPYERQYLSAADAERCPAWRQFRCLCVLRATTFALASMSVRRSFKSCLHGVPNEIRVASQQAPLFFSLRFGRLRLQLSEMHFFHEHHSRCFHPVTCHEVPGGASLASASPSKD